MTILEKCISPNQLLGRTEQVNATANFKMMPVLPITSISDAQSETKSSRFLDLIVQPELVLSVASADQINLQLSVDPSAPTDTENVASAQLLLSIKGNTLDTFTDQTYASTSSCVGISNDKENRDLLQKLIPQKANLCHTFKEFNDTRTRFDVFAVEHNGLVDTAERLMTAARHPSDLIKGLIDTQLEPKIFSLAGPNQVNFIQSLGLLHARASDECRDHIEPLVAPLADVPNKEDTASIAERPLPWWSALPEREAHSLATSAGVALLEQAPRIYRDSVRLTRNSSAQVSLDFERHETFENAVWNDGMSDGRRDTLSAFEQVCAIRFDCGPLFGHAADLHTKISTPTIEIAHRSVHQMTSNSVSNQAANLEHFTYPCVPLSARSDENRFVPIGDASTLSHASLLSAEIGTAAGPTHPELSKKVLGDGESRAISYTRNASALKSKPLANLISSLELMVADDPRNALAVDGDTQASQSLAFSPKSEAVIATLRAQMSPVVVAIYTLEQGLRVFARTGSLSLAGRQKLRENVLTMMAQYGRPISHANLQIDELGIDQDLRRPAQ